MRLFRQIAAVCAVIGLLAAGKTAAQLVNDGETNVLSGVTNSIGGALFIGNSAPGATLILTNATVLNTGWVITGNDLGAGYNTIAVSGTGTAWTNSGFQLGDYGGGNSLYITDGGKLYAPSGLNVAYPSGPPNPPLVGGNRIVISGAGSKVNAGAVKLGVWAGDNSLIITNGGYLQSGFAQAGGAVASSNNVFASIGAGSVWQHDGDLWLGLSGANNRLLVAAGGAYYGTGGMLLGVNDADSFSNAVLVSGPGSIFTNNGVVVGRYGPGNTFVVSNGASALTYSLLIGSQSSATGNSVTLTGSNSHWTTTGVTVGNGSTSNRLVVADGARLDLGGLELSFNSANLANEILVTGGSTFSNSGIARLRGTQSKTSVLDGSTFWTSGTDLFGDSNTLIIAGNGSAWIDNGQMRFVGLNLSVIVSNGAALTTRSIYSEGGANGNSLVFTGPGTTWSNSEYSAFNSVMALRVEDGANVTTGMISIGGSIDLTVTGAGSRWTSTNIFRAIDYFSRFQVRVTNGGTLNLPGGATFTATQVFDNLLAVDGGSLVVTNSAGTALLMIQSGTNILNAGLMDIDVLQVTGAGTLIVNSGLLKVRTVICNNNNGANPLIVGNGTASAELNLNGGTNYVNNLVVATNGTLSGFGIITSTITNFGTLAPVCVPGALVINGGLNLRSNSVLSFGLPGPSASSNGAALTVTGPVQLGGQLRLALTNGYYPPPTTKFTLFNFASATGAFANLTNGMRLNTADNLGSFLVTVTATNVVVSDYFSPDSDGEGQSDYAEFLAGTSASDAASVFAILSIHRAADGVVTLRFPFVAGKSYAVFYKDDFASGGWNTVASPSFTTPLSGINEWADDGSLTGGMVGTTRIYRVGLQ